MNNIKIQIEPIVEVRTKRFEKVNQGGESYYELG